MPSVLYHARGLMTVAALSAILLAGGCGSGNETGNKTDVQMKGLETVDGTINDAMTDLDGVQSEGTAMAQTGNSASPADGPSGKEDKGPDTEAAPDMDAEVVADQ